MTTEQLPDGLSIAVEMIGEYVESVVTASRHPVTGELPPHAEIDQRHGPIAIDAIRSEHHQRVTLQHHAADQAQRIAELEAERDELRARLDALERQEQSEFEVRADGETVRKDRWEVGIRRIVALIWGNRHEFEAADVVDAVRVLVPAPNEDDEALVQSVLGTSRPVPARIGLTNCLPDGIRYALPPLVLTGHQLKQALDFVNPDFGTGTDIDAHQMGSTVCIALRGPGEDTDGEPAPAGLYCWLEECLEEGSIMLAAAPEAAR